MTKSIQQHQQLLTRALTLLNRIESRAELMSEARNATEFNQAKSLKEKSQMEYSEVMAAIHCLTAPLAEVDTNESDAEHLKNFDAYINQLTVDATANGLLDTNATVNAMHNIFSGQVTKATQQAQRNQENYFGENR